MAVVKNRTWPLAEAIEVAEEVIALLRPCCERIEIAGSIRRQRPRVGDIELLAISKTAPAYINTRKGVPLEWVHLDLRVRELIQKDILRYRLNKRGTATFGRWNKLLVHVPSGISLDLFSATVENFGMAWVVRTGPKEMNVRLMARFQQLQCKGHAYGGVELADGTQVACPTEERVFELAGWRYRPPEERG